MGCRSQPVASLSAYAGERSLIPRFSAASGSPAGRLPLAGERSRAGELRPPLLSNAAGAFRSTAPLEQLPNRLGIPFEF